MEIIISEINPKDRDALYSLYSESDIYTKWPIYKQDFDRILFGEDDVNNSKIVFAAKIDKQIVGFISVKYKVIKQDKKAVVVFIFVVESYRKKGVGNKLIQKGINWLKEKGPMEIVVGGGAGSWFWPGIPQDLACNDFFEKNGFKIVDDNRVDMHRNLSEYIP